MHVIEDRDVIRIVVPARLSYRAAAVQAIATACPIARGGRPVIARWDLSMDSLDLSHAFDADVITAFGEVFNNIAIHGFPEGDGVMEIELRARPGQLDIVIREGGRSFDIDAVAPPNLDALPEGGMGLYLARAALDRFEYRPGAPNEWHLSKSIERPRPSASHDIVVVDGAHDEH